MSITAKTDTASAVAGLEQLKGTLRTNLARSMAVAGGKVLRDEAITRCPVGTDSITPGLLKGAIYLAYKSDRSRTDQVVYSVSWNNAKAPHGHLVEFGHWRYYVTYKGKDGEWYTNPKRKLAQPVWVAAHPFLRPALDAAQGRAGQAMLQRARERLPELLAGHIGVPDEP